MNKFAIIKIAGKQYQVSEGDEIVVDKLPDEKGKSIVFDEVLLLVDGEKIQIGQPKVAGVKVKAKIVDELKGEKIRIAIYKSKTRYRKVKGFRAQLTKLKIGKITA